LEPLEARSLLSNVVVNNPAEDTGPNNTQSETSIVLGSGSNVIAGFNDSGSYNGSNNHFTGWSTSSNSGTSWTDQGVLPASAIGDAGDPSLARDNSSGRIYFATLSFSFGNMIPVFRSDNNGATFSAPVNGAPGGSINEFFDKDWITVDNSAGKGQGNVYLVYTDFSPGPPNGRTSGIYFSESTNGGNHWSKGILIAGFPPGGYVQGADVVVGTDHTVDVFYYTQSSSGAASIEVVKSTNLGKSFGSPVTVDNLVTTGGDGDLGLTYSNTNSSSFRTNAFPQAAVNPVTGAIYVVFNDVGTAAGDKADVFLTESTNGGSTWSSPVKVNDDATTTDQWQPAIAVTPDGSHVGVFWYDRRNDPANDSLIDRYGAIYTVSGSTLTPIGPNVKVTDTSFLPWFGVDPVIAFNYMGDYDTVAADNSFFYTTWGDNLTAPTTGPDVYFDRVTTSGVVLGATPASRSVATVSLPSAGTTTAIVAGAARSAWGSPVTKPIAASDARYATMITTDHVGGIMVLPVDDTSTLMDQLIGHAVRKHRASGA
jgi:hypothetical protein